MLITCFTAINSVATTMKKLYTLILFLSCLCVATQAQTMSVKSFTALPNDMDARVVHPMQDQNGSTAALIKVETTEKGFSFNVGVLGVVDVVHDKDGETWVYVPHGVKRITIQHATLGIIRNYYFPISVEAACVYCLVLTTGSVHTIVEENDGGKFFILRTDTPDATLSIDGGTPTIITDGAANTFLPYGDHSYTVSAPMHQPYSGKVTIADEKVDTTVVLTPNFGYFELNTSTAARVELNGIEVGTTPYTSPRLALGDYTVRLSSAGYETKTTTISLVDAGKTLTVNETLVSNMLRVSLSTPLEGATLTVNGEVKGTESWQGSLVPGEYLVTAAKEGYRDSKKRVMVERNASLDFTIDAPTPMYGKLRVNSSQVDVEVAIDDKILGTAPDVFFDILVGSHTVTYTRKGYTTKSERITIDEGKITQANVSLARDAATPQTTQTPKETPKTPEKTKPAASNNDILLLAQVSYHPSQLAYGAMAGYVMGNNGFYLKHTSNFASKNEAIALCNYGGELHVDGTTPQYSGTTHTARYTLTAGYVRRLSSWLMLYAGAGYGERTLQWETSDSDWITNDDCSHAGITVDIGGVVQLGSFALSIGCTTTEFEFAECTAGIGYLF